MIDFSIVKRAIDRADVCGWLAYHSYSDECSDEYDSESEEIAQIICEHDSAKRISEICSNVFSRTFSENITADRFLSVGIEIVEMLNMKIRNERPEDYRAVEELTKRAFHNVNFPGCDEHYLAHKLRGHADFVSELDLVLELDGIPIANIMYTRSALVDENGAEKTVLTFGPLGVLPEYQRRGYGKRLLEHSLEKARELGYEAVVIFGNPENYVSSGFKSCKKYNVSLGGEFPVPLLVCELKEGALSGKSWTYKESAAYNIDMSGFEEFDKDFPQMEKGYLPSQELFYIYSNSKFR